MGGVLMLANNGLVSSSQSHTRCGRSIIGKTFATKVLSAIDFSRGLILERADDDLDLYTQIDTEVMFKVIDLESVQTPMGYWSYIKIKFLNDIHLDYLMASRFSQEKYYEPYMSDDTICLEGHTGYIIIGRSKNFIKIKGNMCDGYDYSCSATYNPDYVKMI